MSIGRLRRKLDVELIARLKAGIRHKPEPMKRVKEHRNPETYRAVRRNASRGEVWKGIMPTGRFYHPPVRENRSPKLPPKRNTSLPIAAE